MLAGMMPTEVAASRQITTRDRRPVDVSYASYGAGSESAQVVWSVDGEVLAYARLNARDEGLEWSVLQCDPRLRGCGLMTSMLRVATDSKLEHVIRADVEHAEFFRRVGFKDLPNTPFLQLDKVAARSWLAR